MIRVAIADDHGIVRDGLRAMLTAEPDLHVVGEARDGREAILVAQHVLPDVLLLDLSMPGFNGIETLRRLRELAPSVRVLVLSMHGAVDYVGPAVAAGAAGFLVKGVGLDHLLVALRTIAAGGQYFGPEAEAALSGSVPGPEDRFLRLTPREREVLQLVAEGSTNKEIGAQLGISPKTVDAHRCNIMSKLDLHDASALTLFALRHGMISGQ